MLVLIYTSNECIELHLKVCSCKTPALILFLILTQNTLLYVNLFQFFSIFENNQLSLPDQQSETQPNS